MLLAPRASPQVKAVFLLHTSRVGASSGVSFLAGSERGLLELPVPCLHGNM